jgi:hypothetical protein
MVRTIIAGVVAGIVMFLWQGFAHSVLPIGHQGVEEIPAANEAAVMAALNDGLGNEAGLYFFPGFGMDHHPTPKEMKEAHAAYMEKAKVSPYGIIVYHPPGSGDMNMSRYYIAEGSLEIVETLICAFLVAAAGIAGFFPRVMFVTGIGTVAAITTNGSYWNWYGFPLDYTLASAFMIFAGFVIAGVVIALLVKKPG